MSFKVCVCGGGRSTGKLFFFFLENSWCTNRPQIRNFCATSSHGGCGERGGRCISIHPLTEISVSCSGAGGQRTSARLFDLVNWDRNWGVAFGSKLASFIQSSVPVYFWFPSPALKTRHFHLCVCVCVCLTMSHVQEQTHALKLQGRSLAWGLHLSEQQVVCLLGYWGVGTTQLLLCVCVCVRVF